MMKFWKRPQFSPNNIIYYMNIKLMRPARTAALFFLALTCLISSCEKPEGKVGIDLLPNEDLLNVQKIDTFKVVSYTLEEDSLRTDKLNPALVGAYNDPIFGFVKSTHVTELRLSTSNPDFLPLDTEIGQIILDSMILALDFQPDYLNQFIYGGSGEQYFQVFEISDTLSVDSFYYDNRSVNLLGEDLIKPGQNLIKPNLRDSVQVGDIKIAPQIRIPLNDVLKDKIFEASLDGPLTQADFVSLIKGICIKVDDSQQNLSRTGIINFDTFNQRSQITMYYRNTNPNPDLSPLEDTVAYVFDIRSNTGKYVAFEQDYSFATYSLSRQLNGDTAIGQRDLYVQSMAGTKVRVEFPSIENLKDSVGLAINKAELIVPVRSAIGRLDAPGRLLLFGLDEDNRIYLTDDQLDGDIGGFYNPVENEYRFTISRQIQQILLDERGNFGLEIVVTQAGNSANRVVLNGPDYPNAENPSDNLKLVITYSKF